MTTTQEEFEAWAKDRGHYLKKRADGVYMDSSACKAWDAWQAAHLAGQRAMRERAAEAAESKVDHQRYAEAEKRSRELGAAGDEDGELVALRHGSDVRLWNSAHEKMVAAIRALEVKPS